MAGFQCSLVHSKGGKIISMAAISAIMYYFPVGFYTHIIACKLDMKPLPRQELPKVWSILKDGFPFLIPLAILIAVLLNSHTPMMSAIYAIAAMVGSSYLRKRTRMSPRDIFSALGNGASILYSIEGYPLGGIEKG